MNRKHEQSIYHANVNVNLLVESVIQIKIGIMINVSWMWKKHHTCEKDYIWNPATCGCENGNYLASIIDNSMITCDEIIDMEAKLYDEETKTNTTNFIEKIVICKI